MNALFRTLVALAATAAAFGQEPPDAVPRLPPWQRSPAMADGRGFVPLPAEAPDDPLLEESWAPPLPDPARVAQESAVRATDLAEADRVASRMLKGRRGPSRSKVAVVATLILGASLAGIATWIYVAVRRTNRL